MIAVTGQMKATIDGLYARKKQRFSSYGEALSALATDYGGELHKTFAEIPFLTVDPAEDILNELLRTSQETRIRVRLSPTLNVEHCLRSYALFFDSIVFTPRLPGIRCGYNPPPFDFDLPHFGAGGYRRWTTDHECMYALMASAQPLFEAGICNFLPIMTDGSCHFWGAEQLKLPAIEHPYMTCTQEEQDAAVHVEAVNQYYHDSLVSDRIGALHPHHFAASQNSSVKCIIPSRDPSLESLAYGSLSLRLPCLSQLPWADVVRIRNDYHVELFELRKSIARAFSELVDTDPSSPLARRHIAGIQGELVDNPIAKLESTLNKNGRRLLMRQAVVGSITAGLAVTTLLGIEIPPEVRSTIGAASLVGLFNELQNYLSTRSDLKANPLMAIKRAAN